MLLDQEVRSALSDIASWHEKLGKPDWDKQIDEDLRPAPEAGGNGDGGGAGAAINAERERRNAKRRQKYAASKEG